VNVLHSSTLDLLLFSISGCASFWPFGGEKEVKPIEIQKKEVERTRLNLAELQPIKARNINWIVITPENAESVWKRMKDSNTDMVLIALTDDGYQELSMTIAELRNYISNQRLIIIKYKDYYEPTENTPTN